MPQKVAEEASWSFEQRQPEPMTALESSIVVAKIERSPWSACACSTAAAPSGSIGAPANTGLRTAVGSMPSAAMCPICLGVIESRRALRRSRAQCRGQLGGT